MANEPTTTTKVNDHGAYDQGAVDTFTRGSTPASVKEGYLKRSSEAQQKTLNQPEPLSGTDLFTHRGSNGR